MILLQLRLILKDMQTKNIFKHNNTSKARVFLGLCCVFGYSVVFAQQTKLDSINLDAQEKEFRIKHPEIFWTSPLEFTETNVFYNFQKLNFKRTQTPSEISEVGLGSKGVFAVKPNLILSGELRVSSENEKAVPFILTDERTTNQNYISNPAYFYAPRESDWMKQHYYLSGSMAYKPIDRLIIGADVRGEFSKSYSNRDPRPEIGNFDYHVDAKIGYQWNKHSIFAKAGYFNRKKESDISYSNPDRNVPNFYESYIRFNRGYGNYYYNNGYSENTYHYDGLALGAEYMYRTSKHQFLLGYRNEFYIDRFTRLYTYQIRDENNVLRTYRDRQKIAGLRTDKHSVYANYLGNLGQWKWSSDLNITDQEDLNFDYQNLNISYKVLNQNLSWRNSWSKYNSKNELFRLNFNANVGKMDLQDVSVVMHKKLSFLDYSIGGEKEFFVKSNQKIAVEVQQGLYLPLQSTMDYRPYQSSQENIFVQNIVMPDQFYDSSMKMQFGLKLKYLMDIENVRYEIFATGNQWFFVKNVNDLYKTSYNTNSNQMLSVGINFYY